MILSSETPNTPTPPTAPLKVKWLSELKDSDRVALLILFLGVAITALATGAHLWIVIKVHGVPEPDMDRVVSFIKDFFEVGTGLIGASLLALKLQPKQNGNGTPPAQ